MKGLRIGVWLVTLVALFTIFSPYVADWNETHIYNPRWPPHAKFHNAQTMAFGPLLGALALYFLWRGRGDAGSNFAIAVIFAGLYWAAQALAFLFPDVAAFDPEFAASAPPTLRGVPGQLLGDFIIFALLGAAYLLERKRTSGRTGVRRRDATSSA